jgi:hypothetical protein
MDFYNNPSKYQYNLHYAWRLAIVEVVSYVAVGVLLGVLLASA